MKTEEQIREQYRLIRGSLDERGRREWAASEAMALGRGGIALVHRASGIVPSTIGKGLKELRARQDGQCEPEERRRVRRPGGGRPSKICEDPELLGALESLVEPSTRGDPESVLRWTCKSLRVLAQELSRLGHTVSYRTVGRLLKRMDYSLQSNRKTLEGAQHADRDAQFGVHQRSEQEAAQGEQSCNISRYEEEGTGRRVQERWPGVSAEGSAGESRCT